MRQVLGLCWEVFPLKYFGNGLEDGHTKKTMQKYIARMKWYHKYNNNEYNFHLKENLTNLHNLIQISY
jgi:hypothetical protein